MTPLRLFPVPEVLEVQEMPSEEVRMVPNQPTATNVLPPKVTPPRYCEVPELLEVHAVPFDERMMVPERPTATTI